MDGDFRRQHFINLIEGTYTNKAQAQSDPTGHAWVWIQWIKLDENKIQSRQWYHHDGDVYRERNFIVDTEGDNVILRNHTLDWKPIGCDLLWRSFGSGYKTDGECKFGEIELFYKGMLTQHQYRLWDQGFKNGKRIIGDVNSEFIFDRQIKRR